MKAFLIVLSILLFVMLCICLYLNKLYKQTILEQYKQLNARPKDETKISKRNASYSVEYPTLYNNFSVAFDIISDINEIITLELDSIAVAPSLNISSIDEDQYSTKYLAIWKNAYVSKLGLLYRLIRDQFTYLEESLDETSKEEYKKELTYIGYYLDQVTE